MKDASFSDISGMFNEALPLRSDQELVFQQLLESISHVEGMGSAAWSITLLDNGFRLNVGQVEAMTFGYAFLPAVESGAEQDASFVDLRLLLAGNDRPDGIPPNDQHGAITPMAYESVGQPHWCYTGTFIPGTVIADDSRGFVAEQLHKLRDAHHAFLELACRTSSGKMRQKSNFNQHHNAALYEYAREVARGTSVSVVKPIDPLLRTRLEKAAADCGFELSPKVVDAGLLLGSSRFPEAVLVKPVGNSEFRISASLPLLLPNLGLPETELAVQSWTALYEVLEKASAVARTLPNRVAQEFGKATQGMPRTTEAERLVVMRVGQDIFRSALLTYWQGRCCVTGLSVPSLLRASHIRPWAECGSDDERLDVFNGLLLAPHLDALFDSGWLTFDDDGTVVVSAALPGDAVTLLSVSTTWRMASIAAAHRTYLAYHRCHVFRQLRL
jgi:putative restriction endonuclease